MRRLLWPGLLAAMVAMGCGPAGSPAPVAGKRPGVVTPTASPAPEPSPPPRKPRFQGLIGPIDAAISAGMEDSSWRPGCPVPKEDLRSILLTHWGFDDRVHQGLLVVHEDVARPVVKVFRKLFRARFPIQRMELIDEYGADDNRSMAANNSSAFNCRAVTGGSGWSEHSYGWAVDINPIQNPYIASDGTVLPPAGSAYADRSRDAHGMIHDGDVVVRAFASIGWEWGGHLQSIKDYQHFSATGD